METQAASAMGSKGTLASVGHSLSALGTATKAFALAHPIGVATAGGALLGIGVYYKLGKMLRKKDAAVQV